MSFQSLISGSDCAATSNPLSQVLKHTDGDRSLQQDKIAGSSTSRLHHLPGTSSMVASERDLAMARQFFESSSGSAPPPMMSQPNFNRPHAMGNSALTEAWKPEQSLRPHENNAIQSWSSEFEGASPMAMQQYPEMSAHSQSDLHRPYIPMQSMYGTSMPTAMGMYNFNAYPSFQPGLQISIDKGKGKSREFEADFEAAFSQIADSLSPLAHAESTSRIEEVNDGVNDVADALNKSRLDESLDESWDRLGLKDTDGAPTKEQLAAWEAASSQLLNDQRDDLDFGDYGAAMQQAWENGSTTATSFGTVVAQKFDAEGLPILDPYMFDKDNKYLDPSSSSLSLLQDAKALLEHNGSLSEAASMLEAAIQKGDLGEGGYEAWILLGETRNMDEREDAGMKALVEGVMRATNAGAAGVGMVSLAISYTNENYDKASHTMLVRWLKDKYPQYALSDDVVATMASHSSWDTHEKVRDAFLNLARAQHSQGIVDPDVQIALGVLFYTNGEYEHAQDCFATALSARPRDYLLWNRYGSSLSNGNKPEEALGAYREALQLRPTYTRAIYNVGVACLNIGAQKEAAEHFLSAIALQDATSGTTSDQLWFTLRRAFMSMNRPDLAEKAQTDHHAHLDEFRREGFEF